MNSHRIIPQRSVWREGAEKRKYGVTRRKVRSTKKWQRGQQERLGRIAGAGFQGDESQWRTLWVAESNPCSRWWAGGMVNGPSQCPPQPTKCFSAPCSIPKTFSVQDQVSYAARRDQDSPCDAVAGGTGEEITLAAVFGMHWRGEVEEQFIIDPKGTSALHNTA